MLQEWKDITADHDEMIRELSELPEGFSKEVRRDFVEKIIDHISLHFRAEDKLMILTRYPDIISHRKSHEEIQNFFLDQIKSLVREEATFEELKNRILDHTESEDSKFEEFLRAIDDRIKARFE